jgi:CheY-like chemotaxis protein
MARIAVVEDNPDNRLLLQALLEDRHQITEYDNGADALAGMRAAPPELVLLDIGLPRMDGAEVLRRMRGDAALAAVPVIALTAHAMSGDRDRFIELGFNDYVAKPIVDETILFASIDRLLRPRS